jgi:hypothetical protein
LRQKNTSTNSSGYFELTHLRKGKQKLKVNAEGYKKASATAEISGLGAYEQNFQLRKKGR